MMETDLNLAESINKKGEEPSCCRASKASGKSDDSNDRKINIMIIGLVGALLIFAGVLYFNERTGFITQSDYEYYKYSNGDSEFEVKKANFQNYAGWYIKFFMGNDETPYLLDVRHDPLSLEDIPIDRSIKKKMADDQQVFITWDPGKGLTVTTTMAGLELIKVIPNNQLFAIPTNTSFTEPYNDRPVMRCEDATSYTTVIYLKLGEETSVTTDGNCIILQGQTEEDIVRAADRLVLYILGIMK